MKDLTLNEVEQVCGAGDNGQVVEVVGSRNDVGPGLTTNEKNEIWRLNGSGGGV
jgi:hypothetical protein